MNNSQIFIVGANGQLGTALRNQYPGAKFADISELDITNQQSVKNFDWSGIQMVAWLLGSEQILYRFVIA